MCYNSLKHLKKDIYFTVKLLTLSFLLIPFLNEKVVAQSVSDNSGLPNVTSDKLDYAPGEVAHISGSGWMLDSQVHVEFLEEPNYPDYHIYDINVGTDGAWSIDYTIEERHLGVKFTVIAVGKQSGSTSKTIFTDADINFSAVGLPSGTSLSVSYRIGSTAPLSGSFLATSNFVPPAQPVAIAVKNNDYIEFKYPDKLIGGINYVAKTITVDGIVQNGPSYTYKLPNSSAKIITANYVASASATTFSNLKSPTITYGAAFITLSGNISSTSTPSGVVSITLNGVTQTAQITSVDATTGFFSSDFSTPSLSVLSSPYVITYSYSGNSNFQAVSNSSNTLSVGKATLTVTAADKSREYGDVNPVLTGSVTGQKNSETFSDTYSTTAVVTSAVGDYDIVPAVTGATLSNYTVVLKNGKLSVSKATLTVTAADKSREYGDVNPVLTGSVTGQKNSETFSDTYSTTAVVTSAVGDYDIVPAVTGATLSNYTVVLKNGKLSVSKATLTVTAADKSREYGDVNPVLTGSVTGQKNSETFSDTYSTTAVVTSAVGDYDIVPAVTGATLSNYTVVLKNGKLSVSKATLTVTAADKSREYGDVNPVLTGSVTGQKNSETFSDTYSTTAVVTSAVGDYDIVPAVTGATLSNYTVVLKNGKLSVSKATLTVTAADKSREYGDVNPVLTGSVTGQKNSETFSDTYSTTAVVTSAVGDYDIVPAVTGATLSNYTVVLKNGKLSVSKATLTVTAADKSREYGDVNPVLTGSVTGQKNSETFSDTYSTTAVVTSAVGDYDIVPAVTGATLSNYTVVLKNGKLSVSKATLTVTAADKSREYGDVNPVLTGSVTGQKNSETFSDTYSTTAVVTSAVGDYDIVPAVTGATLSNYTVVLKNGKLSVSKATLTVTAADKSREYGDVNPVLTGSVTGQKNSETFSDTYSTTAVVTSAVGDYDIVPAVTGATLSNYTVVLKNGKLSVSKATLTVTAADKSREYGDVNPVLTGSVTGQKNSETFSDTYSTTAVVTSAVGDYDIVPAVTGATLSNYTVVLKNGKLSVSKATLTVTAADKSREYGDVNPVLTGSVTGQKNSETFSDTYSTTAVVTSAVGDYDIVPAVTGATLSNYTIVLKNGKLSVSKATLTVTAADKSREYGDVNPVLTGSVTGQKNSETFSDTYSTTAVVTSAVGDYDIVPAVTGATLSNYTIVLKNGKLSVSKATLTVTAADKSREYGDVNPVLTGSVTGQKNSETFSDTYSTTAVVTSAVGDYDIVPAVTGVTLSNYTVVLKNGKLSVSKATLTVTAADKSREYGDVNPVLTGSVTGQKNSETFSDTYSTTAVVTSAVGDYDIVPAVTGATLSNYTVVLKNGKLSVSKATLTVTAADKSREYGDVNPVLTGSVTGQKNSETFSDTYSTTAVVTSAVGDYDIVPAVTGATLSNYTVVLKNGKLSVSKATLTVTAADKSREYGDVNPVLTGSVTGQKNSETFSDTYSTTAVVTSAVGDYDIVPAVTGATLSNYTVVLKNGKLSVSKATLTVTAADKSKYCGQNNPILTFNIIGIKNQENFTVNLTTTSTENSTIGSYPINAKVTGATLPNYTIVYKSGMLTVLGVIVDANSNVTPQAVKISTTTAKVKVTNLAGDPAPNVLVTLYVDSKAPLKAYTDGTGFASFDLGILATDVYKLTAIAGSGCSESTVYMPIYDPNGGFVTGGGWINAVAGSYPASPTSTGKANFGFNSKYKKGSNQPEGNTEFQFQAGNLNFTSSVFDLGSLVISGAKATYKGTGTINGSGNYGFIVIAIDGDMAGAGGIDKFRIKIWNKANNNVVFDNNMGSDENGIPTTALGGGSIVIHDDSKKTNASALTASSTQLGILSNLKIEVLGNPSPSEFTVRSSSSVEKEIIVKVFNISGKEVYTTIQGANSTFKFGASFGLGIYIMKVIQGQEVRVIKLIKGE